MKYLKIISAISLLLFVQTICAQDSRLIYSTDKYQWFSDKFVEGSYESKYLSPGKIASNYISPLDLEKTGNANWSVTNDITKYPAYNSSNPIEEAVYNMGVDEMIFAVEPSLTLRTGKHWPGIWTRDISYSIILSMAYMQPTVSRNSLLHKIDELGRIIQDTGTGGSWPCSSDRVVWAVAAWEIYKVTGDVNWLRTIYPVIKKSIEDDFLIVYDKETGLVMGESSFIDWRAQSYPAWMQPVDIYQSKCLGTNAVHYQTLYILSRIADITGQTEDAKRYADKAADLKAAINKHLWMEDKGYYAQYLYGRNYNLVSPRSETLGESLCMLFGIASPEQQKRIAANMPVVAYGPTIFYPQISNAFPYHNNAIWPFVTSFWTKAAAQAGNDKAVLHSIGSTYRAAAMYGTNKENFVAENGDFKGTRVNSDNMLWSLSGNISVVHNVLFGMQFNEDNLTFAPVIPQELSAKRSLNNVPYRGAKLNIEIEGYGNQIRTFTLDGKETNPVIEPSLTGEHTIRIVMANNSFAETKLNLVANKATLTVPQAELNAGVISWNPVAEAKSYIIFKDGEKLRTQTATTYKLTAQGEYQVMAATDDAERNSFASEPLIYRNDDVIVFNFGQTRIMRGNDITIPFSVEKAGLYALDFEYSNGNGDVTNNNKCAIRAFVLDGQWQGATVLPQRGMDNWHSRGWTNPVHVTLAPGQHIVQLPFRSENQNMNITTNEAVLYRLRISRIK